MGVVSDVAVVSFVVGLAVRCRLNNIKSFTRYDLYEYAQLGTLNVGDYVVVRCKCAEGSNHDAIRRWFVATTTVSPAGNKYLYINSVFMECNVIRHQS